MPHATDVSDRLYEVSLS
ncbi:hypothetical protein SEUBUCD646_0J03000 [Saccharomyces eubayanus]|uniref:Uncharacterized protein n=1 Tax=Saccharomyces eubayanus TaxID=1080349 RepID=A0ABN8VER9_SACEU|nr:hypothetical protein SEUBUCD650_0J02990 [Saccharomyces eubayanus]CAI1542917.1 hypothetical protein SEUBUCD646_0J03000 [Saccharomyces eubayanus]